MPVVVVPQSPASFAFSPTAAPVVRVAVGQRVQFETTDASYETLNGEAIDDGQVDFRQANALSGPVFVDGAMPGDALGFHIEEISVANRAFAVYVQRWRRKQFGMAASRVIRVPIRDSHIELESGQAVQIRPMIGCIGVAPGHGSVSSLSPTARTGGNMDLIEISPGTTIWLPVEIEGGLLSLGDLHARMGRGEPLGSGLECAGSVTGTIHLAHGVQISGPVLCDGKIVGFVGTSVVDWRDAEAIAVRAAWDWLISRGISENDAMVICAALLNVENGGPAGNNVVATFAIADLETTGVQTDAWPISARKRESSERPDPTERAGSCNAARGS